MFVSVTEKWADNSRPVSGSENEAVKAGLLVQSQRKWPNVRFVSVTENVQIAVGLSVGENGLILKGQPQERWAQNCRPVADIEE